jgi:hypothetical protein
VTLQWKLQQSAVGAFNSDCDVTVRLGWVRLGCAFNSVCDVTVRNMQQTGLLNDTLRNFRYVTVNDSQFGLSGRFLINVFFLLQSLNSTAQRNLGMQGKIV